MTVLQFLDEHYTSLWILTALWIVTPWAPFRFHFEKKS